MKTTFTLLILLAAVGAAQDRMTDTLRKGIVAEDSQHDLNAAIQEYKSALTQFDEDRQTAATALFRMAECYRKQGKDALAVDAYRRLIKDFADQKKLADQSRGVLTGTYKKPVTSETPLTDTPAFRQYRETFIQEIEIVDTALQAARKRKEQLIDNGDGIPGLERQLLQLKRDLALVDMGVIGPPSGRSHE